jgi:probable HAF family extracellular repeat protein
MKPYLIFRLMAMLALSLAVHAQQSKSPHYTVTDLGVGRAFSQASAVADNGVVSGVALTSEGTQHAVLWYHDSLLDLHAKRLGGPNSGAFGVNERAEVTGQSETSTFDPKKENFCAYGTGYTCVPFVWRNGRIAQLPLLGGNNGSTFYINNRGKVAGYAETSTRDAECPTKVAANGTGPQVLDFEAVIWNPKRNHVRELPPLLGDSVGIAAWVNDKGETVGTSGRCANTVIPPFVVGPHAVLWDRDGSVTNLGSLGGTANPALLIGNVAFAINNRGQVVGISTLAGNLIVHPFLWTREHGMHDLCAACSDQTIAALAMNDDGDVVGASTSGNLLTGTPFAAIFKDGAAVDLNRLVPANTSLYLLTAFSINNKGEIAGFGVTQAGKLHAFIARPRHREDDDGEEERESSKAAEAKRANIVLSQSDRKLLFQPRHFVGLGPK